MPLIKLKRFFFLCLLLAILFRFAQKTRKNIDYDLEGASLFKGSMKEFSLSQVVKPTILQEFLDLKCLEESNPLQTRLATAAELKDERSFEIMHSLGESVRLHRKQWEFIFIFKVLQELNMLGPGKKALVFAAGEEPLVSFFASKGVHVTATDMDHNAAKEAGWLTDNHKNQFATSKESLFRPNLISRKKFDELVEYRTLDMNHLPAELFQTFDFVWSTCALEHVGSILLGQIFALQSVRLLKQGGVAVHTTEFSLSSLDKTVDYEGTVIWRKKDMYNMLESAKILGINVTPPCFAAGNDELDQKPDVPPYSNLNHVKLRLADHIVTSVGWLFHQV